MATLDFSPAPGAAPRGQRIWRHARTEAMLLVRNGEQLLLALVIPVGVLLLGLLVGPRLGSATLDQAIDAAHLVPSVLALAVVSTAFTSLAIATGFERRYGVLERLAATPLTRGGLLAGKIISLLMITAGQLVLLAVIGLVLGWRPVLSLSGIVLSVLAVILAGIALASAGLLLAGTLRAEITLALANLIHLLLLGAGLLAPLSSYPAAVRPILGALPSTALAEALRGAGTGQTPWWTLGVLAVWAIVAPLITRKAFRWMS